MKKSNFLKTTAVLILAMLWIPLQHVDACTKVVYKGTENTIITARSMDWKDEIDPNLWIFPRGLERSGNVGDMSLKWTSKYGSVITSAWDIATTDGINEKGLVTNILRLVESEYPKFDKEGTKQGLSIAAWAQYVLDFATVKKPWTNCKKRSSWWYPILSPARKNSPPCIFPFQTRPVTTRSSSTSGES